VYRQPQGYHLGEIREAMTLATALGKGESFSFWLATPLFGLSPLAGERSGFMVSKQETVDYAKS